MWKKAEHKILKSNEKKIVMRMMYDVCVVMGARREGEQLAVTSKARRGHRLGLRQRDRLLRMDHPVNLIYLLHRPHLSLLVEELEDVGPSDELMVNILTRPTQNSKRSTFSSVVKVARVKTWKSRVPYREQGAGLHRPLMEDGIFSRPRQ